MDRHDAHGVALAARKHGRVGLGHLEPQVELHAGSRHTQAQVVCKIAQVAHRGQEVGRARAALGALVLKAQKPARLDQRGAHDVCQLPGAHAREGAVQNLKGAGQARRGLDARRHCAFQDARIDAALAKGLEFLLPSGAQGAEIVGVQPKHVAGKQAKEPLLGVVDVCQGMHQRAHDLDLVQAREGRAARDHALDAALAQGVNVGRGLARAAKEKGHVVGVLARGGVGGQTVGHLVGHDGAPVGGRGGARHLDVNAGQVTGLITVNSRRVGQEGHEAGKDARAAAQPAKDGVHKREDVGVAAVVDVQAHVVVGVHRGAATLKDAHVGAAKTIDRLLGVAHGAQALALAAQQTHQLDLALVGVLELVDHHQAKLLAVESGQVVVGLKRSQAQTDQVVVVQVGALGLVSGIGLVELLCDGEKIGQVALQQGEQAILLHAGDGCLQLLGRLFGVARGLGAAA